MTRIDPFPSLAPGIAPGIAVGLTGSPLDRRDDLRANGFGLRALARAPDARVALFSRLRPLLDPADPARLWWVDEQAAPEGAELLFLGLDGDAPRFAVDVGIDATTLGGVVTDPMAAIQTLTGADAAIFAQARAMLSWHATHGHCAVCGAPTQAARGGYERNCTVKACGAAHFPRTDPVVIMLAVDGDRCLLGRQSRFPPRFFSALAGFMEPGESIEEAVRREVLEEAGIRTAAVRYIASQPWPFPSSLMIGCLAQATSTAITIDGNELESADWFSRAEVAEALAGSGRFQPPPPFAMARTLLDSWMAL